jgi:hypothetical protein
MRRQSVWSLTMIAAGWCLAGVGTNFTLAGEEKTKVASAEKLVTIEGTLEDSDPKDKKNNGPSKTFTFKLLKGKAYVIDLISEDFDSFLRLEDAAGKELAWDDDSGGDLNSRIRFDPNKDGEYKVIASSLDGKPGKFTLKVGPVVPVKEVIPAAKDVGKTGFTVTAKLVKGGPVDDGKLTKGAPRLVQPVNMQAGKTYTIDLISDDFDAFLRLLDPKGTEVAFDDDSGGDLNSRIVYECKEDGVFRIIMTSLDRQAGEFTLKVQEK